MICLSLVYWKLFVFSLYSLMVKTITPCTCVILTALGFTFYLSITALHIITAKKLYSLSVITAMMRNNRCGGRSSAADGNREIQKISFVGNTHWFTWETSGSNVSVVSLKTHTQKQHVMDGKMLISHRHWETWGQMFWIVLQILFFHMFVPSLRPLLEVLGVPFLQSHPAETKRY